MNHIVLSCPLPRKCTVADVEVRDSRGTCPTHLSSCVPVEMLDKHRHSATEPISKYTFHFSLHFSMRLLLYDGLVARD